MRKRNGVILAVIGYIIFFFCMEGWGADWKLFAEVNFPEGWSSKHYYDTESIIKTKEGNIRVWVSIKNEKVTEDVPKDTPSSFKNLVEINCSLREERHLKISRYFTNGRYEEEGQNDWDHISPDGSLEDLYKVICGNVKE